MPDISAASGVATIVLALIGLAGAVHQLTKNSSREAQAETITSTLLLFLLVIAVVAAPAWVFPVFAVNVACSLWVMLPPKSWHHPAVSSVINEAAKTTRAVPCLS